MITTTNSNLVKEGYLDVKVPPGNRERKLWKAWQRRWFVAKSVEEPCGLELLIYGCHKTTNAHPLWRVFISPELGKLYRSRSRTHASAFSIAHEAAVLMHLAGESEQLSQSWMACIRDALWPPSPLVQLEAAFQDVHRVSLIDDEKTCCSDLFGAYGHLYMAGDVILLMSTHSGRLIKEWCLGNVLKAELERLDEGNTSGVFSLTLQNASSQHGQKLCFYSQTATSVVENLSAALKTRREGKGTLSGQSALKYDSGIQELSEILSLELKPSYSEHWSGCSQELSEGMRNLAAMSGDFLNCSLNSVLSHHAYSNGSRSSSAASSEDYSPPLSPVDNTSPNQDSASSAKKIKENSSEDDYYYYTDVKLRRHSFEGTDLNDEVLASPRSSTTSDIYTDITSIPHSKRPSIAETLYEDIEDDDDDEGFFNLMDKITEDEYMPPLPPPRNTPTCEQSSNGNSNRAKRPSTLGLENLSSSISETLSQIKTLNESPNYKTSKRSFSSGLFKPIKGVKKILGNKKTTKSPLASPTSENSSINVSSNPNCVPKANATSNIGGHCSTPSLIKTVADSTEMAHSGSSNSDGNSLDLNNSPTLILDDNFIPFPELLTTPAGNDEEEPCEEMKQCDNLPPVETSSVVIRDGNTCKHTRSCDSIIVESLKSKYSNHRQFLEFLQDSKSGNESNGRGSQQNYISRSISLEHFSCKSVYSRRRSSSNNESMSHDIIANLRNEDLRKATSTTDPYHSRSYLSKVGLQRGLTRRRSSDYCTINPVLSTDSTREPEIYLSMHTQNGESGIIKEPLKKECSNSFQMKVTEYESLYMDMTRTTK